MGALPEGTANVRERIIAAERTRNASLSDAIINHFLTKVPVTSGGLRWHSATEPYRQGSERTLAVTVMATARKDVNSLAIVLLPEPSAEGYQSLERVSGSVHELIDLQVSGLSGSRAVFPSLDSAEMPQRSFAETYGREIRYREILQDVVRVFGIEVDHVPARREVAA